MYYLRFELPALPEIVYEWLTEDAKLAQWMYSGVETRYQHSDTSSHNAGRFTRVYQQGGKERSCEGELLASEPPYRVSYRMLDKNYTRQVNFQLQRQDDDSTYLTYSSDCKYHDSLGLLPLLAWFLEWRHRRQLRQQIHTLRRRLAQ